MEAEEYLQESRANPSLVITPHHACYIMYTSGSTGKPKGVVVENRGVVNTLKEYIKVINLTPSENCVQFASFSFDVSVLDIFLAFFSGAALFLVSKDIIADFDSFSRFLLEKKITVLVLTPSYLRHINNAALAAIRVLISAGEEAIPRSALHLRDEQEYYNGYGPTECSIAATIYKETSNTGRNVPIGKPIGNMQVFILDSNLQLVPEGVAGEIYLSGTGVGRGYLNNPALTAAMFIPSPFETGRLLYRTGDQGRWLKDGNIEYLGRIDEQVKIRGYRIELREIESVLQQSELVQQAAVVVKGADKKLVAFYVPGLEQLAIKEQELCLQQVESWKQIYKDTYSHVEGPGIIKTTTAGGEMTDPEFDITGWNDSFTGKAIPAAQMRLWLNDISTLMLALHPRNVLEIGSGTGMIYYQIAGHIQHYTGTDFSAAAIDKIRARIAAGERVYPETILKVCAAHEVALDAGREVDLIILNSIIQHFPAEAYLATVLDRCIGMLKEKKGHIVIGDVRDLRLLTAFKGRLQLGKCAETIPIEEFNWRVDQEVLKEEELCIDPNWFFQLQNKYPAISGVSITWKQGDFSNELSRYRYTVVLQIGGSTEPGQPRWTPWDQVSDKRIIIEQLNRGEEVIALQHVPNHRLQKEKLFIEALANQKVKNVGQLAHYIAGADRETEQVEEILAAARTHGYRCHMYIAPDPLKMHLLLEKTSESSVSAGRYLAQTGVAPYAGDGEHLANRKWTNMPLFADSCTALQKDIRRHLQNSLPEFMVPVDFIAVQSLPMTISRKVDRQFLSIVPGRVQKSSFQYQAPETGMEQMVAAIWQDLLETEQVGINDNFFELGGHSLKAGQFINRVYKQTGIKLLFSEIFQRATLRDVAALIDAGHASGLAEFESIPERDYYPLSPSQKGIWLTVQQKEQETFYNIPISIALNGPVQFTALKKAFDILINSHESLRTSFPQIDGIPYQQIKTGVNADIEVLHIENNQYPDSLVKAVLSDHIQTHFNLAEGPLFRISLVYLPENKALLVFTIHHLISDGFSVQLLMEQLIENYEWLLKGKAINPVQEFQYKDYGYWLQKIIESGEGERQKNYWLSALQHVHSFSLARYTGRRPNATKEGALYTVRYAPMLNQGIKQLAAQSGCTVFMILQALLKLLLYKITGQRDIIIGTALSGRVKEETEKITGCLINTVALYNAVNGANTFATFLQQVKTTTLEGLENQLFPLHRIIELVQPEANTLFDVMISVDDQQLQINRGIFSTSDPVIDLLQEVYNAVRFNIDFSFDTRKEELGLQVLYDTSVFDKSTIMLFTRYFNNLATQVIANPQHAIDNYLLYYGNEPELYEYLGISDEEFESVYGLTTTQRDIYLTCSLDPEGSGLRLLVYLEIDGPVDAILWKMAIEKVTGQEDSLRSVLITRDTEVFQGVKRQAEINFTCIDISEESDFHQDIKDLIRKYCQASHNLNNTGFSHYLFRLGEHQYIAATSAHHLFVDGVSFRLLIEKIAGAYHLLKEGNSLLTSSVPYREYVFNHLVKFDTAATEHFWRQRLSDVQPLSYSGALSEMDTIFSDSLIIATEEALQIMAYCKKNRLKPSVFFKAIYALLVKYYCNADHDFCIRENVAGRSRQHVNTIGCISHCFPLLIREDSFNNAAGFAEWCGCLQQQKMEANQFRHISLSLQNRIIGEEQLSFFYNYEYFSRPVTTLETSPLLQLYYLINNQVELRVVEGQEAFELKLDYNERIFNGKNFLNRIRHLAAQIVFENRLFHELQFLTADELKQLDHFGNHKGIQSEKNILELFEEQVNRRPQNIAIVSGDKKITYANLDNRSDQVAAHLQKLLPGNGETIIGIMVERSEWMIIALLGVLKTGAAYLPIDPDYPPERINYLLQDSKASLLITHAAWKERSISITNVLFVEDIPAATQSPVKGKRKILPNQLAYVIYTSGTTGNPKGVMMEHHSLSNIAQAWKNAYHLNHFDGSLLQVAGFSFDVFTGDVVRTLTNGGKMIICPSETRLHIPSLYELIYEHQVNIIESTPALIVPLMEYVYEQKKDISCLQLLILGSDVCPVTHFKTLVERFAPAMRIINSYGVTETCIDAGFYEGTADCLPVSGNTPIGKPLENYIYRVCNAAHQLVPIGVPGILFIGGEGVARGYAGQKALTNEKFIQHAFNNERLYNTGDMVRWLPDGNLEFSGRKDNQVKIRGYRIELQEVESALLKHQDVKEALVTFHDTENGKELTGWYVSKTGAPVTGLTGFIKQHLPSYMAPACFILLDRLPLTSNGKVNRKALPDPTVYIEGEETTGELPNTETEVLLLTIWEDILKRKHIGITDNFFELGGHSLKATNAIARIFSAFRVNLPLNVFFSGPSIKEQAAYIDKQKQEAVSAIKPAPAKAFYPLSSSQNRLYLLHQVEGAKNSYNIPVAWWVSGTINKGLLEKCFTALIARHEILRTSFEMRNGQPVQCVQEPFPFTIEEPESPAGDINDLIRSFIQPFDLSAPPLLRARLYNFADGRQLFLLDMHHIISDGVSANILIGELTRLCNGENLSPLTIQYKDFAVWQHNFLASETIKEQEKYWLKVFAEEVPAFNLQTDFPRPLYKTFNGKTKRIQLADEICSSLHVLARQAGCTINQLLLTNFYILLYKYSGNEDIVVGMPVAGRTRAETHNLTGVFVNTLALRAYPSGTKILKDLLVEVGQASIEALKNQDYPFEMLVDRLDLKRERTRHPLFDILFSFQHEERDHITLGGALLTPVKDIYEASKFDLSVHGIKTGHTIELIAEYNNDLFDESTIAGLLQHYVNLLQAITTNLNRRIADISILSAAEEKMILAEGNNCFVNYPAHKCLHELFEEQAVKFPARTALVWNDEEITYHTLNQQANQVAAAIQRTLREAKNPIIAVLLHRGAEMVIALLGILKAGGAYLPIDPDYPAARIRYTLEDSQPAVLITHSGIEAGLHFSGKRIDIDRLDVQAAYTSPRVLPDDLAYIIYTSGSTGNPKGVMITHRNVVRLLFNDTNLFDFTEKDTWTLFHSYCFDFSVWEMYGALLFGGKLVIIPKATAQNPAAFLQVVKDQQVTVLNQTPGSFYNIIEEEMGHPSSALALRYVIFGGEALKPGKLARWKERYPQCKLINMYGITETTVHVTYKEIALPEIIRNTSNIGKPIPTLSVLILDRDLNLSPQGAAGELCVGGAGLAKGYLNRPELTAARFIDHPYVPGEKLYRTGDLAKLGITGDFEYLGRIDQQVKIRGFRIEPGEIESKLMQHNEVADALVIDIEREAGTRYLCAYIIAAATLNTSSLRRYLLDSLPEYMVPSFFVRMEKFPLTGNGKIDKKRLPLPEASDMLAVVYEAPGSATEKALADLWMKLLQVPRVGLNDHFFELGGYSLKAAQLVALVHERFHVGLSIQNIFATPYLRDMASLIAKSVVTTHYRIERAPEMPYYPASPAAKRIFILHQLGNAGVSYNIPGVYAIEGNIDWPTFSQAIQTITRRHHILRSAFVIENGEVVQVIDDHTEAHIENHYCEDDSLNDIISSFVRPFDLSKAPLLRTGLVQTTSGQCFFLVDIHHIIADDLSVDNFVKELAALYSGAAVSELSIQYNDFSVWQTKWLQSEEARTQKAFWKSQFPEPPPLLNMPVDFVRPPVKSYEGALYRFMIPGNTAGALKALSQSEGATPFMLMLAAYTILLSKYSGQEDIIVGAPVAGRSHADLQHLIGMFVNTLPLRNFPAGETTFTDYLRQVKENLLNALENQDYPFEALIDYLEIKRDMGRNPLFDYMFTYRPDNKTTIRISNLLLTQIPLPHTVSKMDISMEVAENEEGQLSVVIEYATKLFTPQTIERFAGHFRQILDQIVLHPHILLRDIELVTSTERIQLTQPERVTPEEERNIYDLFEENVQRYPHHIAVEDDKAAVTYEQLHEMVCTLAGLLSSKDCEPGMIVGLYTDRSIEMVAGILAIFKTGAVYLPLDTAYPQERIRYMLEDSAAVLVLTQKKYEAGLSFVKNMIFLDELPLPASPITTKNITRSAESLAYVIYTSGSTGKPKGVPIRHSSLYNFLVGHAMAFDNGIAPHDVCTAISSASFDASVMEIFAPLTAGARLVMISRERVYDIRALANILVSKKISYCFLPPSLLPPLYSVLKNSDALALNKLSVGAEPVKESVLRNYTALNKNLQIVNFYGPTEATIASSCYKYQPGDAEGTNVSIGKPMLNTRIYIVNEYMKLQPVGVPGELCIAGKGLAEGYLNNPGLTKEVFIDNPFEPGKKLYKTGDLARWLPDGNIEFIGRKDHQVKIRGLRIELGEIENRLLAHPDIKQVLVADRSDGEGNKFLCAWLVSATELSSSALHQHIARELPEYMIPSYFIRLEKFPLTRNGKIDRQALPEPVPEKEQLTDALNMPVDAMEKKVLAIWQSVLGLENISVTDNFFEIGGNSLKIINMLNLFRESMGDLVKVNDLFDKPTIRQQAAILSQASVPAALQTKKAKRMQF
jgi:amino acid adenylation domain-containing protein